MITIFTPTYNRADLIIRLYESLIKQTNKSFEWIVVDDGSTDNTRDVFNSILKKDSNFIIRYFKQENGGKCSAINTGVKHASGDWFIIVDSDDYLVENAVDRIISHTSKIEDKAEFCAIGFLRAFPNGRCVGGEVDYFQLDSDFFSYRDKLKYNGDRAEVIRTSVLREFPFPVFPEERFLSEAVVWNRIAKSYKCRYVNEKIYICEYQCGGLSDSSSRLFSNNPKGSMLYYKELYGMSNRVKTKLESSMLYWRFRFSSSINKDRELSPYASMYMFLMFYPLYLVLRYFRHQCIGSIFQRLNSND